ncbi:MAG: dienelactone hydrolase family protein [Acidimicrobiia bacterium]
MANVLLFHHALGRTDGVLRFADDLRAAGHEVSVPDLYGGAVFDDLDIGVAHADDLGMMTLVEAGAAIADQQDVPTVFAGFSLGGLVAHKLAQTAPAAVGALLYHYGDVPIETFGDVWPESVPVQLHIAEDDPFGEEETLKAFVDVADQSAGAELIVYPGSAHLFTDATSTEYDEQSASLVLERTLEFLTHVDNGA